MKSSLGCGKEMTRIGIKGIEFICGVANAWGTERLCNECDAKMRRKWAEEDRRKVFKEDNLKKGVLK